MKKYIVITWPEIQYLMQEKEFYKHCHLINDTEGLNEYGSSAYFCDEEWLNNISN